ncbi:Rossmann-fold NAD(P)-binding domain-containing protein [Kineobactrum salinum]|uniref:Uncharacterized protein n=1 Tax=Kineobactrum salinum TaxID=2708301 RepID=A0A6C0U199_9GAMM|nr:hypothetical protein [Kineobactrum salinum]QIB65339.1 hypothetical protein G3T16_07940 [Kineobactrum salinum]
MKLHRMLTAAVLVLLTLPAIAQPQSARELIARLDLSAADHPVDSHPRWQPARVVVTLPAGMASAMPDYIDQLRQAAGDTELVLDESGKPSAELLAGADGYIGFCTNELLANADPELLWIHSYAVGMDRCSGAEPALLADRIFTNNKRLSAPLSRNMPSPCCWVSVAACLPIPRPRPSANGAGSCRRNCISAS